MRLHVSRDPLSDQKRESEIGERQEWERMRVREAIFRPELLLCIHIGSGLTGAVLQ